MIFRNLRYILKNFLFIIFFVFLVASLFAVVSKHYSPPPAKDINICIHTSDLSHAAIFPILVSGAPQQYIALYLIKNQNDYALKALIPGQEDQVFDNADPQLKIDFSKNNQDIQISSKGKVIANISSMAIVNARSFRQEFFGSNPYANIRGLEENAIPIYGADCATLIKNKNFNLLNSWNQLSKKEILQIFISFSLDVLALLAFPFILIGIWHAIKISQSDTNLHYKFNGIILICWFLYLITLTLGFSKFGTDSFSSLHDEVAKTLLALRLDTTDYALAGEAFQVDGLLYSYYGITPSLLRIPFHLILSFIKPSYLELINLSLLSNIFGFLLCLKLLTLIIPKTNVYVLFSISIFLVFLSTGTFTYHENILWGLNFAFLSIFYFQNKKIYQTLFFVFLCLHSRPTMGFGVLIFLTLQSGLIRNGINHWKRPYLFAFGSIFIFISYLSLNYLKFNHFAPLPGQHIQQSINVPDLKSYSSWIYFPKHIFLYLFSPGFFEQINIRILLSEFFEKFTSYRRDLQITEEPIFGIIYAPFFLLALIQGFKNWACSWPALLSSTIVFFIILTYGGNSHRYLFDIIPCLILVFNCGKIKSNIFLFISVVLFSVAYLTFTFLCRANNPFAFLP